MTHRAAGRGGYCVHPDLEDPSGYEDAEALGGFAFGALFYQRLGYDVLPLARGGKRPHRMLGEEGGVHWATRDPAMPPWAWQCDPAANVGVATGRRSRLVVIDLDVKGEVDGRAVYRRFLAGSGLQFTPAPWVSTPHGGEHIWLHWPYDAPAGNRVGILPGVDVRGDGGLVAAPPSRIPVSFPPRGGEPGGQALVPYRWHGCCCELPGAPEWMVTWLRDAPAAGPAGGGDHGELPGIGELARTGVAVGERNQTFYRLACARMRARRGDVAGVRNDLYAVWQASDTSDFPWREAEVIIESARRYITAQMEHEYRLSHMWRQKFG